MSSIVLSLAGFLVLVCVLVTVHEFGHYWVARRLGFKVLRFSVGFGRPLWLRRSERSGTEYVFAAVPLGGYVKLLDEREGPVAPAELSRSFTRRPHWQRIAVLLAGPAANFLFAILLLAAMLLAYGTTELRPVQAAPLANSPAARAGVRAGDEVLAVNGQPVSSQAGVCVSLIEGLASTRPLTLQLRGSDGKQRQAQFSFASPAERRALTDPASAPECLGLQIQQLPVRAVLGEVMAGGPAQLAGLRSGDEILSIDNEPVRDFQALVAMVNAHPGDAIAVQYRRNGVTASTRVGVIAEMQDGVRIGRIKVRPSMLPEFPPGIERHSRPGPLKALAMAGTEAWAMTRFQVHMIWGMLAGEVSVKNLGGPISIAKYAGDSAAAGFATFFYYLVQVSLMLGFVNLLPIPILDGGQVLMQSIEWLKGSPLSERMQLAGQQLGIALVLLLLGLALYNDITRQFG
ncbi:MAG: RIP metalloprotease RseP [Gammaproteobacteria bacterium]|nr:RIP metalloprotease RseP [Gammaproteobacteria bacterium]MDE2252430.1 RIP metalloprotease RseP [Gammaproteobacteria bacterium]